MAAALFVSGTPDAPWVGCLDERHHGRYAWTGRIGSILPGSRRGTQRSVDLSGQVAPVAPRGRRRKWAGAPIAGVAMIAMCTSTSRSPVASSAAERGGSRGLSRHPVRGATGALRCAAAGSGLGRRAGGDEVRAATSAVRRLRHGRAGRHGRRLVDGQRVVARPQRRVAGDGVDSGRCLHVRHVRPARVRRQQPRARRRRRGDLQLPGRAGRLRVRRGNARQPRSAGPGRGARVGAGQHRRVRR